MSLPCHLLLSSTDGGLYDTRNPDWSRLPPLRPNYRKSCREITTVGHLKATLRAGAFTEVGGYPLHLVLSDGEALSFPAARENFRSLVAAIRWGLRQDGWRPVGTDINHENLGLTCVHSGEPIPAACGA